MTRLVASVEITNGGGTFRSLDPGVVDSLQQPRLEFTATKTLDSTPNPATIRLYGLSLDTLDRITGTVRKRISFSAEEIAQLEEAGASTQPIEITYDNAGLASVQLSWAYQEAGQTIGSQPLSVGFIGGSNSMSVVNEGVERVLVINAEDGAQVLGAGRLQRVFAPGTALAEMFVSLGEACGLRVDLQTIQTIIEEAFVRRGIPLGNAILGVSWNASVRPARDIIDAITRTLQLRWSIQDGEFFLVDSQTVLQGYPPIEVSDRRGNLLGPVERLEAQQARAITFADAELRPGREVTLLTSGFDAQYRIDEVTHAGDTYGGGTSTLTLTEIQVIQGLF